MEKQKLFVIKVGGAVVEDENSLMGMLEMFNRVAGQKVLVHGGGRSATRMAEKLGIETRMVNGRRITDAEMLKVVTMVYGGLVNKNIVAKLQTLGVNALGLTGADLDYMESTKRPLKDGVDYGYVGDVNSVDSDILGMLIRQGIVPVLAPLTFDGEGTLLNTNADTIASEAAKALASDFDVTLIFCFEKRGVLREENDDNSVINCITEEDFQQYKEDGTISGGMIPKLENAFGALKAGVKEVIITRADQLSTGGGTIIVKE